MEQIVAAVNTQNATALKAMFSASALEEATEFDHRLQSLLAVFPSGGLSWERIEVNSIGDAAGEVTKLLTTYYKASADGKDYWLFFADFVVDANDPGNVGLASLAVTPWFEPGASDRDHAFTDWTSAWGHEAYGSTGIYIPTG